MKLKTLEIIFIIVCYEIGKFIGSYFEIGEKLWKTFQ